MRDMTQSEKIESTGKIERLVCSGEMESIEFNWIKFSVSVEDYRNQPQWLYHQWQPSRPLQ